MLSDRTVGKIESLISAMVLSFTYYAVKDSAHNAQQMTFIRGMSNVPLLYLQAMYQKEDLFGSWTQLEKCCTRMGWQGSILLNSDFRNLHDADHQLTPDYNILNNDKTQRVLSIFCECILFQATF